MQNMLVSLKYQVALPEVFLMVNDYGVAISDKVYSVLLFSLYLIQEQFNGMYAHHIKL